MKNQPITKHTFLRNLLINVALVACTVALIV